MVVVRITLAPSAFSIIIKRSIYFSGAENGANPEAKKRIQSRKDSLFPVKGIVQTKRIHYLPGKQSDKLKNALLSVYIYRIYLKKQANIRLIKK